MMLGKQLLKILIPTLMLTGCSSMPDWANPGTWFEDEEELEIRKLEPITPKFTPEIVWEAQIGDGVRHYFSRLKPAVGYDKVYAASRQGDVKAFDQASGKEVWSINLAEFRDEGILTGFSKLWSDGISAKVAGGLTVAYQTLYLGTENGLVVALDTDTGAVKWQQKVKGEVLASPVVDEGIVVVNTGAGTMYGLDARTGEEKWVYESEVPPLTLRGISAPAVAAGGAVVGTASGKLAVTLLETGQVAWEQTIATASGSTELERMVDIDSQALVLGGVVYVISYNGTLASIELRSGRVIWKREYRSYRRLSLDGNSLFVVDDKSQIYALDRRNGVESWTHISLRGRELTSATPVGDYIVVGDKYGYLHWLTQSNGELVARVAVGGDDEDESIYAAPIEDGNMVYTQTRDGQLVAIKTPE
ncbi:outer membrane protein assembly factor BamB [Paraneptunicella aestuarii]|uniref:outer membrane protein assembly factor BamB n=1 Tax=Paraneptunicella aestuarii TaxID=2831148 RepID=UPI0038CDB691